MSRDNQLTSDESELRKQLESLEDQQSQASPPFSVRIGRARTELALRIGKIFVYIQEEGWGTGVFGITNEFPIDVLGLSLIYAKHEDNSVSCDITWVVASGIGAMEIQLRVGEQIVFSTSAVNQRKAHYFIRAFATYQEANVYADSRR